MGLDSSIRVSRGERGAEEEVVEEEEAEEEVQMRGAGCVPSSVLGDPMCDGGRVKSWNDPRMKDKAQRNESTIHLAH